MEAIYAIWLREVKRYLRGRTQFIGSLARAGLWLFILGNGLRPSFRGAGGADYIHFLFPGIVAMTLIFSAVSSAISIVWDREFGFLKELLVAPIPRSSIAIGKTLGGATQATLQGAVVLALAPLAGVPVPWRLVLPVLGIMFLISYALTALGVMVAARMASMEGFGTVVNFIILPLYFLSGAIFPLEGLPDWLHVLIRVNPLTYGVDLMRGILIGVNSFLPSTSLLFLLIFAVATNVAAVALFRREG